jgi:hypothetical protein
VLAAIGVVVAFWAGMRWRRNTMNWATHRVQAGRARDAKKAKWASFWAAVVSCAVLVAYAFIASSTAVRADDSSHSPAPHSTKSASVSHGHK